MLLYLPINASKLKMKDTYFHGTFSLSYEITKSVLIFVLVIQLR